MSEPTTPAIERAAEHLYGLYDRPAAARAALVAALDTEEMARALARFDSIEWSNMRTETRAVYREMAEALRAALVGEA